MAALCKVTKMNVQHKRQEAVCCVISHQGCPNLLVYNHFQISITALKGYSGVLPFH